MAIEDAQAIINGNLTAEEITSQYPQYADLIGKDGRAAKDCGWWSGIKCVVAIGGEGVYKSLIFI